MPSWIRGVNLGGWLVLERFITPYLFAITTCHLQGNFCYYPGQMDAPPREDPSYRECNLKTCRPVLLKSPITGELDYPVDEYSLLQLFDDPLIASKFMDLHYQHFVTRQDIRNLKEAGITHVRVPLPHWILTPSSLEAEEPWVSDNNAWLYFLRLVGWCRQDGIEVWPDLHTAPGMQNDFMNSAQVNDEGDVDDDDDVADDDSTCARWNVNRTLAALQSICNEIAKDGLTDVVTGFGILNEPVRDCDLQVVRDYSERALTIVRSTLGNDTSIHVGDMFNSTLWNDGWWESNPNTYLDSHYYHVFAQETRHMSPRQHIAYVCSKNARDTNACCYQDYPHHTNPTNGIHRIIGEWSASFDTLPVAMLEYVMKGIATNGEAPYFKRTISKARGNFLRNFVEAQMVTYEAAEVKVSHGWFFWTLKTEGGAFAEWDFLRGIKEGWIPKIPPPNVSSVDWYGNCQDIIFRTDDDMSLVEEYPNPKMLDSNNGQDLNIDDDLVISHGNSLLKTRSPEDGEATGTADSKESDIPSANNDGNLPDAKNISSKRAADEKENESAKEKKKKGGFNLFALGAIAFFALAIKHVFLDGDDRRRSLGYRSVDSEASLTMSV